MSFPASTIGAIRYSEPPHWKAQSAYELCLCASWLVAQGFSFEASSAASLLQMDRCEIAFVQIGNSDRRQPVLADVRRRSATFTPQKLPKAPQMNKRTRARWLKLLALPRGVEPLFSP